jgi:hypothetical protein
LKIRGSKTRGGCKSLDVNGACKPVGSGWVAMPGLLGVALGNFGGGSLAVGVLGDTKGPERNGTLHDMVSTQLGSHHKKITLKGMRSKSPWRAASHA